MMEVAARTRMPIPLTLVGVLLMLAPIAWASPVDPVFAGGVFDVADYDEVVQIVLSMDGSLENAPALVGLPTLGLRLLLAAEPDVPAASLARVVDARAPPIV